MTGDLVIFLSKLIQRQISNKSKTCFRSTKVERNLVRFSKPLWEISRGTWQIQPCIKIWINIGLWPFFFPFLFFCVFCCLSGFSTSFSFFSSFDFPLTAPVVHACCCPPCFSIDKVTFLFFFCVFCCLSGFFYFFFLLFFLRFPLDCPRCPRLLLSTLFFNW